MKNKMTEPTETLTQMNKGLNLLLTTAVATLTCLPVFATDRSRDHDQDDEETHYQQINLVSDISGVAQLQDTIPLHEGKAAGRAMSAQRPMNQPGNCRATGERCPISCRETSHPTLINIRTMVGAAARE